MWAMNGWIWPWPTVLVFSQSEHCSVMSDSLQPHRLYSPCNSPGQNTGVGSLSLLQGIVPTQGLNPGLPHCRQILYQLSHKGSPRILELGRLSLLQRIFPTRELNQGLLDCSWFLYQLSYPGIQLVFKAGSILQSIGSQRVRHDWVTEQQ